MKTEKHTHHHYHLKPRIVSLTLAAHLLGDVSERHVRDLIVDGFLVPNCPPIKSKVDNMIKEGKLRVCMKSIDEYIDSGFKKSLEEQAEEILGSAIARANKGVKISKGG